MTKLLSCFLFWGVFLFITYCSLGEGSLRTNVEDISRKIKEDKVNFKIKLPSMRFSNGNPLGSLITNEGTGGLEDARIIYHMNGTAEDGPLETYSLPYSIFPSLLNAIYLFSSICFIFSLRGLSDHKTSRRGNLLGCVGIVTAVLITFSQVGFGFRYGLFAMVIIPAVVLGYYIAKNVSMIQMPQLVALFHSFVGLAALLVGFSKFHSFAFLSSEMNILHLSELYVGTFIAAITFIGSLVAAGKLSEILESRSLNLKSKKAINIICMIIIIIFGYYFITSDVLYTKTACLYASLVVELFLGFHLTASVGGADMPVVISVLNSYSGFATTISGFLLNNSLLITAGSLIGSSGAILSYIMCVGMNRHIGNIILGGWDDESSLENVMEKQKKQKVSTITHKFVADDLINAKKVIIIPGYGVAVSKCQRELADIANVLKNKKIDVSFAIHPVAGRMPGHLNVLLAEANIPHHIVKEMDEINTVIANADVVLIVGANDIVNPSTFDPSSKIYGMPVIEAWKAKKVVIMKRTLATGYSHIDNPLFYYPNACLLFGDAKFSTNQILSVLNDYSRHKTIVQSSKQSKVGAISEEEQADDGLFELEDSSSTDREVSIVNEESYPKPRKVIGLIRETQDEMVSTPGIWNKMLVPITPKFIPRLRKMGFRVLVESDIGTNIMIYNEEYIKFGAELATRENILKQSNIILKVDPPTPDLINAIPDNTVFISYIWPGTNRNLLNSMVEDTQKQNITYLAIDEVPRSTRAQKLDIRTSMSNLQGYRAVIEAFFLLPKFSKSSTTAAGKINPAKVFIIGAGVAGLQAIVTAKSLGAIVFAHDTRSSTEEEVKSCGGIFIKVPLPEEAKNTGTYAKTMSEEYMALQRQIFMKVIKKCDVIICCAAIPGKTSPKLVSTDMIKLMKAGSVAVDLATEFGDKENNWGGNIECSQSNRNVIVNGVHVLGRDTIERNMPRQASDLFSMNLINLLEEMGGGLQFNVDINNDIIKSLVVVKNRTILYNPDKPDSKSDTSESVFVVKKEDIFDDSADVMDISDIQKYYHKGPTLLQQILSSDIFFCAFLAAVLALICIFGTVLSIRDIHHLSLFVFSVIIGYYCVWSVTPALHTPLISVTNALSGVIIIGSMVESGSGLHDVSTILSVIATFLAALNLSGGFYVTQRMLDMFSA